MSDPYSDRATGVAADAEVFTLIDDLPQAKRQLNLVFAAAGMAGVQLAPYARPETT